MIEAGEEIEEENQSEPERVRRITIVVPRDEQQQEGMGTKSCTKIKIL